MSWQIDRETFDDIVERSKEKNNFDGLWDYIAWAHNTFDGTCPRCGHTGRVPDGVCVHRFEDTDYCIDCRLLKKHINRSEESDE